MRTSSCCYIKMMMMSYVCLLHEVEMLTLRLALCRCCKQFFVIMNRKEGENKIMTNALYTVVISLKVEGRRRKTLVMTHILNKCQKKRTDLQVSLIQHTTS